MPTRFRPTLISAAAAALLLPFLSAFVGAAPAVAGRDMHKHEVAMYRVDKYVNLAGVGTDTVGDTPFQSLSCNGGDTVTDGMWLVDHVDPYVPVTDPDGDPDYPPDGPDPSAYNDQRDVQVDASYPSWDNRTWNFRFDNTAYGDAQVKLYVLCIHGSTEQASGHNHSISVGMLGTETSSSTSYSWQKLCTKDQYFVAPGFELHGAPYRLVGSFPKSGPNPSVPADTKGWNWEFALSNPNHPASFGNATFYGKCINRLTTVAWPAHQHAISMRWAPTSYVDRTVGPGSPQWVQYQCDEDNSAMHNYKAMTASFYLLNNSKTWFLGMEPRPKIRAYSFLATTSNQTVKVGTLCIDGRTSFKIK